jgi:hypothetical protein
MTRRPVLMAHSIRMTPRNRGPGGDTNVMPGLVFGVRYWSISPQRGFDPAAER